MKNEERKTTSGEISAILEVLLSNKIFQTLYKMKMEKKVDFAEILQDIFQNGLGE
ncbi:MAG: hypothetical protein ACFFD2_27070 [Promethearchaeota archaeon]